MKRQQKAKGGNKVSKKRANGKLPPQMSLELASANGESNDNDECIDLSFRPERPPCMVCGDVSSGYHCGADVCEACKKFFIRSLKQDMSRYHCNKNEECVITKETRADCPSCRWRQCTELGMARHGIGGGKKLDMGTLPCGVCGSPSSGYHFGAITCEGCKGFFRRTIIDNQWRKYKCEKSDRCVMQKGNRKSCKFCRYQRCLEIGMTASGSKVGRQTNAARRDTFLKIQAFASKQNSQSNPEIKQEALSPNVSFSAAEAGLGEDSTIALSTTLAETLVLNTKEAATYSPSTYKETSSSVVKYKMTSAPYSLASSTNDSANISGRLVAPSHYPPMALHSPDHFKKFNHQDAKSHKSTCINAQRFLPSAAFHRADDEPPPLIKMEPCSAFSTALNPVAFNALQTGGKLWDGLPAAHAADDVASVMDLHHSRRQMSEDLYYSPANLASASHVLPPSDATIAPARSPALQPLSSDDVIEETGTESGDDIERILSALDNVLNEPLDVVTVTSEESLQSGTRLNPELSIAQIKSIMDSPAQSPFVTQMANSVQLSFNNNPPNEKAPTEEMSRFGRDSDLHQKLTELMDAWQLIDGVMELNREVHEYIVPSDAMPEVQHKIQTGFECICHHLLRYAKKLPEFKSLDLETQKLLIQRSLYPIMVVVASREYKINENRWRFFHFQQYEAEQVLFVYCPPFKIIKENFRQCAEIMQEIEWDDNERALFATIYFFNEAIGFNSKYNNVLLNIQDNYVNLLQRYCKECKDDHSGQRFCYILAMLPYMERWNQCHMLSIQSVTAVQAVDFGGLYHEVYDTSRTSDKVALAMNKRFFPPT